MSPNTVPLLILLNARRSAMYGIQKLNTTANNFNQLAQMSQRYIPAIVSLCAGTATRSATHLYTVRYDVCNYIIRFMCRTLTVYGVACSSRVTSLPMGMFKGHSWVHINMCI